MKAHFACFYPLLIISFVPEERLKLAFGDERQRVIQTGEKVLDIWNAVTETADKTTTINSIWQGEPRDHRRSPFRRVHQECANGLGS